jgi:hypothetical protein
MFRKCNMQLDEVGMILQLTLDARWNINEGRVTWTTKVIPTAEPFS